MTTSRGKVCVVIPARDEALSIGRVIESLPDTWVDHIIVCDNDSHDATSEIAGAAGAQVVFEAKAGYGSACLKALSVLPDDTDIVVFLDGDFSDDPGELPRLVGPIAQGECDLVLGSRVEHAKPGALTPQQRFGNWLATRLLFLIYRHRFTDLGPFRAIRRKALDGLAMKDRGMGWTVEMQLKALRQGLRIREIPVSYRPRIGRSKISGTIKGSLRAACKIIFLIGVEVFRKGQGRRNR